MKPKHTASERLHARETLRALNIAVGQDFHTLNINQVVGLLAAADRERYQRPAKANGNRARYFHDRLQRRARDVHHRPAHYCTDTAQGEKP